MLKTELLTVRAHHMKFLPELLRFGAIDFAKKQLDEYYFNFEIKKKEAESFAWAIKTIKAKRLLPEFRIWFETFGKFAAHKIQFVNTSEPKLVGNPDDFSYILKIPTSSAKREDWYLDLPTNLSDTILISSVSKDIFFKLTDFFIAYNNYCHLYKPKIGFPGILEALNNIQNNLILKDLNYYSDLLQSNSSSNRGIREKIYVSFYEFLLQSVKNQLVLKLVFSEDMLCLACRGGDDTGEHCKEIEGNNRDMILMNTLQNKYPNQIKVIGNAILVPHSVYSQNNFKIV